MSEKKNIDRLFQEKFRDFEVAPPPMAWDNIEAELLKKKKKRRVIPLWYRVGGVAAILVIGLMLSMPLFTGNDSTDTNSIVIENGNDNNQPGRIYPTKDPIQPNEVVADSSAAFGNNPESAVASGDNGVKNRNSGDGDSQTGISNTSEKENTSFGKSSADNAVASGEGNNSNRAKQKNNNTTTLKNNTRLKNAVKAEEGIANKSGNTKGSAKSKISESQMQNGNSALAQREAKNGNGKINNRNAQQFEDVRNSTSVTPDKQTQAVAATQQNNSGNSSVKNNAGSIDKTKAITADTKLNDALANAPVAKDSTAQQENELEKLLKEKQLGKEKEEEKALAENASKWNIKPQLAPVFYNSMGSGSPIDSQLSNNSKSYDNGVSYGLGVNYAVNNKVSIRTGINTVNLSYSTNNIQFYAALNEQTPNVAARGTKANIVVQNQGTGGGSSFAETEMSQQKFNGAMVQKMGYIEVPLEMSYKVLNTRFGIDLIGGVSTLFLNDNNVSVVSNQGLASDMGEAQNLNNIHFSTNIGVGFRYRFWKAFEANFEPMFKYQVNTFSNDSGNFKPYFIGLYSGISFSF